MRQTNDQKLGDVIKELLDQYKLNDKINAVDIINSWESVVGKLINKHTQDLYIKKKVLFVKLDSPALKNELSYERTKITDSLNEAVGMKVIEKVVFI